jgi:hypothetical protein
MNIEAYLLCYNEEKMIRHTLNYYSIFCNKITIYDNESTDSTLAIIQQEYPKVNVITYKSGNKLNDLEHVKIKNECWKGSQADYVIVADLDELLWHPDLINVLTTYKNHDIALPAIMGHNMFSDSFPEDYSKLITQQVTTGVRAHNFDKQIIFDPKKVQHICYSPGAHTCKPILNCPAGELVNPDLILNVLHYKYLGERYLIDKHKMYASRMSPFNMENGYGGEYLKGKSHVQQCFKLIRAAKTGLINIAM